MRMFRPVSLQLTNPEVPDGANHVAFAYSEDGKDRFTTVYPNLNLLTDTKDFINKNTALKEEKTSISSPDSVILKEGHDTYLNFSKVSQPDWFRAIMAMDSSFSPNFPDVDLKPNSQYTFSVWLKGKGEHYIIAYDSWTNPVQKTMTINLTDAWTKYAFTVNTAGTIPTQGTQFFIRSSNAGSEINLKYPKVEQGSIATPWLPSFSEATAEDYPSYIGTYTDNNSNEQSTDPLRYTWKKIE